MSFQTATVIEFKKLVANKLQAERIQELFTELVVNKCKDQIQRSMLRANKKSKAKQLPLVLEAIDKLSDEDVLLLPTHEELQQIDRHLFVRKVNEVDVANEAGIDIESLLGGEHFQLQGRDSRRFNFLTEGFHPLFST